MSCDTDVSLAIRADKKEDLEAAIQWQINKEKLWKKCSNKGGGVKEAVAKKAIKDNGLSGYEELVTWGMGFDKNTKAKKKRGEKYFEVKSEMWANQNGRNVWITGETGELAHFLKNNPEVWIEGECRDEYEQECCIEAQWDKKAKAIDGCLGLGADW